MAAVRLAANTLCQALCRVIARKAPGGCSSCHKASRCSQDLREPLSEKIGGNFALRQDPTPACCREGLAVALLMVVGGEGIGDQQRRSTRRSQFRYRRGPGTADQKMSCRQSLRHIGEEGLQLRGNAGLVVEGGHLVAITAAELLDHT